MRFVTPPECQGQIVQESYACAASHIVMRVYDASDRTTAYFVSKITKRDWAAWYEEYDPANGRPPRRQWSRCRSGMPSFCKEVV